MNLGKRADYAIRAVLYLSTHQADHRWHKAQRIASVMEIPSKFLPQLMGPLVHRGWVESEPGPDGGYRLAIPGDEVTLLQVIEAVDGSMASTECVLRVGPCRTEDICVVHIPWSEAQEAFRRRLAATSFSELTTTFSLIERGL